MGQARIDPNEQLHGGDANPRFGARYRSLEILCQAAVPIEPGEGSVRRPIGDAVEQACEIRRVVVAKDVLFLRRPTASYAGSESRKPSRSWASPSSVGYHAAGTFQLQRKTRRDRMLGKLKDIKAELRRRIHQPIPEQGR